jgi:8-oxo-dGTP pyrophosphatase MutT (NUDIX family)
VILMRDATAGLELLMVQRTHAARFMAGHWVFPGGAVDGADGDGQTGLRAAARREVAEETAISLGDELVPFARWITPAQSEIRFDTWFYLAPAPAGAEVEVDGVEIVASRWLAPLAALGGAAAGELVLALPTEKQLEALSGFVSVEEALADARARVDTIRPVEPRIVGSGDDARIVLPGDEE